jgi:ribose transport system substrate-binding protein
MLIVVQKFDTWHRLERGSGAETGGNYMIKNIASLLAAGILVVAAGGDAFAQDRPDWLKGNLRKPLSEVRIGFSHLGIGIDGYTTTYYKTFIDYAKKLGVQAVVLDAQVDAAKQASQVQDLLNQNIDALIIWPVNPKAVVPSMKLAAEAHVPVIVTNSLSDESGNKYLTAYTGPDNYTQGKEAGQMMVEALDGKGNVVMVNCLPGYAVSMQREAGFRDGIKDHPDIKVLDSQTGNANREKAQSLMEAYLTRFGDQINGVYACNDNMGIGVLNAIKEAGKAGKIKITSSTLFGVGYDAIKAGDYYGSVEQSPAEDAKLAFKIAIMAAEGLPINKQEFMETPPVTKKNIGDYQRPVF